MAVYTDRSWFCIGKFDIILNDDVCISLNAFSACDEHVANSSLVGLNFKPVHGVVRFMNDFNGFGCFDGEFNIDSFKLYKFTTPDLHLVKLNENKN